MATEHPEPPAEDRHADIKAQLMAAKGNLPRRAALAAEFLEQHHREHCWCREPEVAVPAVGALGTRSEFGEIAARAVAKCALCRAAYHAARRRFLASIDDADARELLHEQLMGWDEARLVTALESQGPDGDAAMIAAVEEVLDHLQLYYRPRINAALVGAISVTLLPQKRHVAGGTGVWLLLFHPAEPAAKWARMLVPRQPPLAHFTRDVEAVVRAAAARIGSTDAFHSVPFPLSTDAHELVKSLRHLVEHASPEVVAALDEACPQLGEVVVARLLAPGAVQGLWTLTAILDSLLSARQRRFWDAFSDGPQALEVCQQIFAPGSEAWALLRGDPNATPLLARGQRTLLRCVRLLVCSLVPDHVTEAARVAEFAFSSLNAQRRDWKPAVVRMLCEETLETALFATASAGDWSSAPLLDAMWPAAVSAACECVRVAAAGPSGTLPPPAVLTRCVASLMGIQCRATRAAYDALCPAASSTTNVTFAWRAFERIVDSSAPLWTCLATDRAPENLRGVYSALLGPVCELAMVSGEQLAAVATPFTQQQCGHVTQAVRGTVACAAAVFESLASSGGAQDDPALVQALELLFSPSTAMQRAALALARLAFRGTGPTRVLVLRHAFLHHLAATAPVLEAATARARAILEQTAVCALDLFETAASVELDVVNCLVHTVIDSSDVPVALVRELGRFVSLGFSHAQHWARRDHAQTDRIVRLVLERAAPLALALVDAVGGVWTRLFSSSSDFGPAASARRDAWKLAVEAARGVIGSATRWLRVTNAAVQAAIVGLVQCAITTGLISVADSLDEEAVGLTKTWKRFALDEDGKGVLGTAERLRLCLALGLPVPESARSVSANPASNAPQRMLAAAEFRKAPTVMAAASSSSTFTPTPTVKPLKAAPAEKRKAGPDSLDSLWNERDLAARLAAQTHQKAAAKRAAPEFQIGRPGAGGTGELSLLERVRYVSQHGQAAPRGPNALAAAAAAVRQAKTRTQAKPAAGNAGYTYIAAPVVTASSVAAAGQAKAAEATARMRARMAKRDAATRSGASASDDSSTDEDGPARGAAAGVADDLRSLYSDWKQRQSAAAAAGAPAATTTQLLDLPAGGRGRSGSRGDSGRQREPSPPLLTLEMLHERLIEWDPAFFGDKNAASVRSDRNAAFEAISKPLRAVPNVFRSVREYVHVFEPLLVLELWEHVGQALEETADDEPATAKLVDVTHVDSCADLVLSGSRALQDHDVILVGLDKDLRVLGVVQAPALGAKSRGGPTVTVRVNVARRGSVLRPLLTTGRSVQALRLMGLSSTQREYQCLMHLSRYALGPVVLDPLAHPPSSIVKNSHGPPPPSTATLVARFGLNEPQAEAIAAALSRPTGFSLIQGPPGTGKTKTVLALLALLLTQRRSRAVSRPAGATTSAPTAALLCCAPSNAAIDEIVRRLRRGVQGPNGELFVPAVVRVGAFEAVHEDVREVLLDALADERVGEQERESDSARAGELRRELETLRDAQTQTRNELFLMDGGDAAGERARVEARLAQLAARRAAVLDKLDALRDTKRSGAQGRAALEAARAAARRQVLGEADVILATLSASGHDSLAESGCRFDTVVIDEACQAVELSTLIPLQYSARRCVLVGDPNQLPPTVLSQTAAQFQYEQSLFQRIARVSPASVRLLSVQYRMHPEISRLPSVLFYNGRLEDAPDVLRRCAAPWHSSSPLLGPYAFFNVGRGRERVGRGHSLHNPDEAIACVELVRFLCWRNPRVFFGGRIGIVTPYSMQRSELKRRLSAAFGSEVCREIDVNTVDGFQGQEKDVIIFSCVRAARGGGGPTGFGFLADVRRMNVALTRARCSLFIIGHASAVSRNRVWRQVVDDARERRALHEYSPTLFHNHNGKGIPLQFRPANLADDGLGGVTTAS